MYDAQQANAQVEYAVQKIMENGAYYTPVGIALILAELTKAIAIIAQNVDNLKTTEGGSQ